MIASAMPPSRMAAAAGRSAAGRGFEGFSDIFSSIFGEFMDPRAQRASAARGSDLRYDLELTLEEAFAGSEKTISIQALARCEACNASGSKGHAAPARCGTCGGAGKVRAQQGFFVVERGCPTCMGSGETVADPCSSCDGEGRALKARKLNVNIPAGVDEGTRIRVAGEGEAGVRGAASGDLYLFVHLKRHAIFSREGTTLIAEAPISFTTAALGGSIAIPGIDGERIEVKIPAGIQSGETLRQRGRGHERAERPRPRRPDDPHPGRNAVQAQQGSEGDPGAIPRHRDRRRMPGQQGLLQPDQGTAGRLGPPAVPRHAGGEALGKQVRNRPALGTTAARLAVMGMDRLRPIRRRSAAAASWSHAFPMAARLSRSPCIGREEGAHAEARSRRSRQRADRLGIAVGNDGWKA